MKKLCHFSLVIIIYLFSHIHHILGVDHGHLENESSKNNNITMNSDGFIFMLFINLLLCIIIIFYYFKYQNYYSSSCHQPLSRDQNLSSQTNHIKNISSLSDFIPLKPHRTFIVHRGQAQLLLDELIYETKRTKVFTIVPRSESLNNNYMLINIELIQEMQTIIAVIEYFNDTDIDHHNSEYFFTLRQFFRNIFKISNTIQTWGNTARLLRPYIKYDLFSLYNIKQSQTINIQKEFKLWYNHTFRHHRQCHQYLKYDETDGSLCSCSFRPYKSSSNQWSVAKALAYTFDEQINYEYYHGLHRCLAITKLAHVISQKWTIEQLNNRKQTLGDNHQQSI